MQREYKNQSIRPVEVLVVSDLHLGTYGCHAKELLSYFKSIDPQHIILNGDIIDIWQFSKSYFPKSHMKVIKHIMKWVSKGKRVTYITGNHDELLRKFEGIELGTFELKNKLVLDLGGQKTWIFHGDVFDVTMQYSKWLTRLGAIGYDTLILLNKAVNWTLFKLGQERISLSKRVKDKVKTAVSFINSFEDTVAEIAAENNFQTVICGHIHHPIIKNIPTKTGQVGYLNSGDWVENLTALEYSGNKWSLYQFDLTAKEPLPDPVEFIKDQIDRSTKELFAELLLEVNLSTAGK